jgi:DegV family protein with EDD domain
VSCLDPEEARAAGVQVVPVPFVMDGRDYLDGVDITAEQFYARLERSGKAPSTSAPSPAAYMEAFEAAGTPTIVCVTGSATVGTTAERCELAIKQARERWPERRFELFVAGCAAMGQGFLALEAARAATEGADADTVLQLLRRLRPGAHLLIVLDTLKYLAQTGRLQAIGVLAGSMLSIKPIVHVNDDHFDPVEMCRSRRRAIERLLDRLLALTAQEKPPRIAVQHAAAPDAAEALADQAAQRLPGVEVTVVPFSPVMGTYAGPGLLGFAWLQGAQS